MGKRGEELAQQSGEASLDPSLIVVPLPGVIWNNLEFILMVSSLTPSRQTRERKKEKGGFCLKDTFLRYHHFDSTIPV